MNDPAEPNLSWAYRNRITVTIAVAVGSLAIALAVFFLFGTPMGWPLGMKFNLIFIAMGVVFIAVGISVILNPKSVTVGGITDHSTGHIRGGSTATKGQGVVFGISFLLSGLGMTLFAIFMGSFLGAKQMDSECMFLCDITGECVLRNGKCIAVSEEACGESDLCTRAGMCTLQADYCWSEGSSEDECNRPRGTQSSSPCKNWGECRTQEGLCKAGDDSDCQRSLACEQENRCKIRDGKCINPEEVPWNP